jgi:hypothetical protein
MLPIQRTPRKNIQRASQSGLTANIGGRNLNLDAWDTVPDNPHVGLSRIPHKKLNFNNRQDSLRQGNYARLHVGRERKIKRFLGVLSNKKWLLFY